ncbi:hypothetical protein MKY37_21530 [Psychrobacillus sp. FSL K6-2836]|uniref:uridine kinase family protein n=1 Tax=Psychrobacillus sp. FSL K6-2836 TaxID=2921548 RepID=UPI0030F5FCBB
MEMSIKPYLNIIEQLRSSISKNEPLIVAIDGRSASGKTTCADVIVNELDGFVIHMDDFFLPMKERLSNWQKQIAGNIHISKITQDILKPITMGKTFTFKPYNCQMSKYDATIVIPKKSLYIIEGSYSMHPDLQIFYHHSIFLTISPETQEQRIIRRNGKKDFENFQKKWIPMEELYIKKLAIHNHCDFILDTTNLF